MKTHKENMEHLVFLHFLKIHIQEWIRIIRAKLHVLLLLIHVTFQTCQLPQLITQIETSSCNTFL